MHLLPALVALATGQITGVEALVRWHHPQRGLVSPAEFIPLAEETGLIRPLGQWVLRAACRQASIMHALNPRAVPLLISVNLSAREFQHPDLVENVARIYARRGPTPATCSSRSPKWGDGRCADRHRHPGATQTPRRAPGD